MREFKLWHVSKDPRGQTRVPVKGWGFAWGAVLFLLSGGGIISFPCH